MSDIGYVVIEYNQASGQPELGAFPFLSDNREEVQERMELLQRENRAAGRRERYAIGTIYVEDEGE
jgi:hypothetical protein